MTSGLAPEENNKASESSRCIVIFPLRSLANVVGAFVKYLLTVAGEGGMMIRM